LRDLSNWILKKMGWKVLGEVPDIQKFIAILFPHTSNWDFIIGRLFFYAVGRSPKFLMKKELFIFPLGFILKKMGGIPVDRNNKTNITEELVTTFQLHKGFILTITPEGTRSKVTEWKKGFYNISKSANVPIIPAYFDYSRKIIGIGDAHFAEATFEEEMDRLKLFYKGVQPKHPQRFTL
jgi:1-acyl-sn-glycerol-3-phosphate acyltransferase